MEGAKLAITRGIIEIKEPLEINSKKKEVKQKKVRRKILLKIRLRNFSEIRVIKTKQRKSMII